MGESKGMWHFIIERLVPAATGGYTYYKDLPVIIFIVHTVLFAFLSLFPIALFSFTSQKVLGIIHPILVMVICFFIKLINYQIHVSFDRQTNTDMELNGAILQRNEETITPPFGISRSIWNIRDRLTDFSNIDINTLFVELMSEGYNSNELFHFFEVYQSGQLSLFPPPERTTVNTNPVVSSTTIKIFCFEFEVKWTRKDLENWFDRSYHLIEVILSPMLACICGLLCFLSTSFMNQGEKTLVIVATATAQFSLLKAPNPDSSSTTMQDQFVPYSRSFHLIAFQFLFSFLNFLANFSWVANAKMDVFDTEIPFTSIVKIGADAVRIVIILFPFINALGMAGSLKDSWFVTIEVLQKLMLGKSGAITFYSANLQFLMDIIIIAALTEIHAAVRIGWPRSLISSLSVFYGYFLAVIPAYTPFITKALNFESRNLVTIDQDRKQKTVIFGLIRAFWAFVLVFFLQFFKLVESKFFLLGASLFLIATSFVSHEIMPKMTLRHPYGIFSQPFFESTDKVRFFIRVTTEIERCILVPITIASLIANSKDKSFGFMQAVESLIQTTLITGVTCSAIRNPSKFALVLTLNSLTSQYFTNSLLQTLIFMDIFIKLDEFSQKLQYVWRYASLHSLTSAWQIIAFVGSLANAQFTILAILVATVLVSPLIPVKGWPIFIPSYPRPSIFWFSQETDTRPGDSLFYKSLSDSLAERLADDVNTGRLPLSSEGNFYLITDDYFNAIVQIISTGIGLIVFQLRGLEVREQTLCHRNELQTVRSDLEGAEEIRTFMNSSVMSMLTEPFFMLLNQILPRLGMPESLTKKQRAFVKSCTWKTLLDDYKLDAYSVSANRLDQIFPDKHHQLLLYINLVRTLALCIGEGDEIDVPEDFDVGAPEELIEAVGGWIEECGSEEVGREVWAVSAVLMNELEKIPGGFDMKIYRMFVTPMAGIYNYLWIPSDVGPKLSRAFRNAVSLAVYDASMALPDESEELKQLILEKLQSDKVLPENDARWISLVESKVSDLETVRFVQEPDDVVVKHMLFTRREQSYRVIGINGEEVRGIWAGQIQEMVFMESTDRERSSIQFDAFTLRNILSQSADSPVGYPEVICPISYSFARNAN